jgi:hypothetical protein
MMTSPLFEDFSSVLEFAPGHKHDVILQSIWWTVKKAEAGGSDLITFLEDTREVFERIVPQASRERVTEWCPKWLFLLEK